MNAYADEHEQWESLKNWWKINWKVVVFSITAALILSYGYRYWQSSQQVKIEHAAQLYDQLLSANTPDQLTAFAESLEKNYPRTPYASLAALTEAKNAVASNNLSLADKKLAWVVEHTKSHALREIARVREASVLLAENQPDQALKILATVEDKAYFPAVNQVKGDIYLAQGNTLAAQAAYSAALLGAPPSMPIHPYLKMEVEQLPKK